MVASCNGDNSISDFRTITDYVDILCIYWGDDGWSTLCHSYGFPCYQRVLKTFPSPSCLRFKDELIYGIYW